MSETTSVTEIPPAPQQSHKRRNLIIGAVAVASAAGIAIGLSLDSSGPGTITVHGTLTLGPLGSGDTANPLSAADGDPCNATGGYTDIVPGAAVTIGNSTGQTLATGALSAGREANVDSSLGFPAGECVFSFSVQVPGGESAYTVTISHRGTTTFTPAQAQAGVALSLGQ